MNRLIIGLLTAAIIATPATIYPQTLVVTSVNHTPDFTGNFTAATYTGIEYTINQDPQDLTSGDMISVIMFNRGTATINDDSIIRYQYTGF